MAKILSMPAGVPSTIEINYTSQATAANVTAQHILATAAKNGSVTLQIKARYSASCNVDNVSTAFGNSKITIGQTDYLIKDYCTDARGWSMDNSFTLSGLSISAGDTVAMSFIMPSVTLSSATVTWDVTGVVS